MALIRHAFILVGAIEAFLYSDAEFSKESEALISFGFTYAVNTTRKGRYRARRG